MLQKTKRVKLYGKKLRELNNAIFERDNYRCIICGAYVSPDHKFHHEKKFLKNDVITEGVVLCDKCHYERHFGKNCNQIKQKCRIYLNQLYNEGDETC